MSDNNNRCSKGLGCTSVVIISMLVYSCRSGDLTNRVSKLESQQDATNAKNVFLVDALSETINTDPALRKRMEDKGFVFDKEGTIVGKKAALEATSTQPAPATQPEMPR